MSCHCGNGSSGGQILQFSQYCGGDFTRGAEWSERNIALVIILSAAVVGTNTIRGLIFL